MAKVLKIKVLEAYTRDVGRNRARLDYATMKKLGAATGDPIEIKKEEKIIVGTILPLYPSDEGKGIMRIEGSARVDLIASKGDMVTIRKIHDKLASHVEVVPGEVWPPIDERYLADALDTTLFRVGMTGMIPYYGGRLIFQVVKTAPDAEAVFIDKDITKFKISPRIEPETKLKTIVKKARKELPDEKEFQEYITRRIFSVLQDIKEINEENELDTKKSKAKTIYDNLTELIKQAEAAYPNNDFIPKSINSFSEIESTYGIVGTIQFLKSLIRNLADAVNLKHLEIHFDKKALGNDIFIVHGHDETAKEKVARFIEKIELKAIILHEQPNKGRTIIEKFENYSSQIGFAVIILTPDDTNISEDDKGKKVEQKRARQNVILELGFFVGAIGRERTCVLYKEVVEIPSDYDGVVYVKMDENDAWKLSLAKEIKQVGIPVDLNKIVE